MEKKKTYQGFWLGSSWVSRCSRCGDICFTVADEEYHNGVKCVKAKLIPLDPGETDVNNPPKSKP